MPNPLFRFEHEEIRGRLTAAILSLCESERLVFTLYYHEGLTTQEIALVLGETVFAVLQLHVSALTTVKLRLADPEKHAVQAERGNLLAIDSSADPGTGNSREL
jgi:DNA-directed RNA polymerase specialized sigma24 family protein